jgi:hypothetical protein
VISTISYSQITRWSLVPSVILALFASGCGVVGSGNVVEESHDLSPYHSVVVGDGFSTRIEAGDSFSVRIRADDNLIDDVDLEVDGARVSIDLGGLNYRKATLEAIFTLPRLEGVSARDGSLVEAYEVPLSKNFEMDLSGGSSAWVDPPSEQKLDYLVLDSTGGSFFDLRAEVETTLLSIEGGGTARLRGVTRHLTADLSGGSVLEAWDYPASELAFSLSGGSVVQAEVSQRAQGRLSGGSLLQLRGDATVDAETSGGSAVERD